jgi:hypothetical protein
MKYLIGSVFIYLTFKSTRIDPLTKVTLYTLIAGIVYYLP